jgi:Flp pilus assembly protein TadG
MQAISQQRKRRSRGSVFVETAFVFMGFAAMVIGTFDFAQFLFTHQALVERVRSAARWGSVNGPTNTDAIRNMVLYNQPTAINSGPNQPAPGYFGLTAANVVVSTNDAGTANYRLTVRIQNYQFSLLSPWMAGVYSDRPIQMTIPIAVT